MNILCLLLTRVGNITILIRRSAENGGILRWAREIWQFSWLLLSPTPQPPLNTLLPSPFLVRRIGPFSNTLCTEIQFLILLEHEDETNLVIILTNTDKLTPSPFI